METLVSFDVWVVVLFCNPWVKIRPYIYVSGWWFSFVYRHSLFPSTINRYLLQQYLLFPSHWEITVGSLSSIILERELHPHTINRPQTWHRPLVEQCSMHFRRFEAISFPAKRGIIGGVRCCVWKTENGLLCSPHFPTPPHEKLKYKNAAQKQKKRVECPRALPNKLFFFGIYAFCF